MLSQALIALSVVVGCALVGGLSGLLAVRWYIARQADALTTPESTDPFVAAQIDRAAVNWAATHGRPEAAGMMADKLHMLHRLAQRRGPS